jgi:hypothetical protein
MLGFVSNLRKFKFVCNLMKLILNLILNLILQLRCVIMKEMTGYLMGDNHILSILLLC